MADNDDVKVKFGADIADLQSKMGEVSGLFKTFADHFAAIAAVVGGGTAFKAFIDETITLNSEALKLSKTLGLTGAAAGTLNTALGDIGADAETYTSAFLHFNRSLRQNSDEMKAMGVDINGLRSGQKSSNEVFVESLAIFGQYRPGIDQTQAAMKLFGRSVDDVQKLQRLANEVTEATAKRLGESRDALNNTLSPLEKYNANMETAAEKNKALNLSITSEGLDATRQYKEAMNEVGDVMKGVSKTIGEAVMPHFTEMANQLADFGPTIVAVMKLMVASMMNIWETLGETVSVIWGAIRDDVLLPLKDLWQQVFGTDGPGAMEIFNNALKVIEMAFVGFRIAFELLALATKTGIELMSEYFVRYAEVVERALHFDLTGAKAAWQSGVDEHNRILEKGMKDAIVIAQKGQDDLDKIANRSTEVPGGTAAGAPKGGDKTMKIGKNTGDDPRLAAQLALQKAQQEASLHLQLEYLKEAGDAADEAYKHNLISIQEYYDAKTAIETMANQATLAARRQELADAQAAEQKAQGNADSSVKSEERRKHEAEVVKFRTEQVKLQGQINILEQQGLDITRRVGQERSDAEQKLADQLNTIGATRAKANADMDVSLAKGALDQMKALRLIDADEQFNGQRALEDKSYEATRAFLQAKRDLIHNTDLVALAQQSADEEAAEKAHQLRLTEIDRAAVLERAKYSIEAQKSVETGFATMLSGLMSGQKTLLDAVRNFALTIAQAFENLIAKKFAERLFGDGSPGGQMIDKLTKPIIDAIETIVVKWIGAETAQTAASETMSAARVAFRQSEIAAQTAAQTAGIAEQKAASIAEVMSYASVAAAAAMASVAAIPLVGWAMAPEVGATTYATAMGFMATAEQGWGEVPVDGALAQLHKKEMVLPASLADSVRKMTSPGLAQPASQQPAAVAGGDTYHLNVSALDARSVQRLFDEHGPALVASLKKQGRNFAF